MGVRGAMAAARGDVPVEVFGAGLGHAVAAASIWVPEVLVVALLRQTIAVAAFRGNFEVLAGRTFLVSANKGARSRVPLHAFRDLGVCGKWGAEALATLVVPIEVGSAGLGGRLQADALAVHVIPGKVLTTSSGGRQAETSADFLVPVECLRADFRFALATTIVLVEHFACTAYLGPADTLVDVGVVVIAAVVTDIIKRRASASLNIPVGFQSLSVSGNDWHASQGILSWIWETNACARQLIKETRIGVFWVASAGAVLLHE